MGSREPQFNVPIVLVAICVLLCTASSVPAQTVLSREILAGARLSVGFDMGVDTSERRTDWVGSDPSGAMRMAYPAGQAWGAVFITLGPPKAPPRPFQDFSVYSTLLVELRGDPGSTVEIAIKDNTQPDDGTEAKVILPLFENWRTYAIPVAQFNRAALNRLYVVAQFVFSGPQPQNAWCRSIRYTTEPAPAISSVSSAASFQEGAGKGSWISITGRTLSPVVRAWAAEDFKNNSLPRALDGVSVQLNERELPVSYISPAQVNSLILEDEPGGESYVSVSNTAGTSIPSRIIVQHVFPGCFALPPEGGRYVAAVHADGVIVGKAELLGSVVRARPAKPGEVVAVYCTGLGSTVYPGDTATISTDARTSPDLGRIDVRIGTASASVDFAGLVQPGLYQLNIAIPEVPGGEQPFSLIVKGISTRQKLFISIEPEP